MAVRLRPSFPGSGSSYKRKKRVLQRQHALLWKIPKMRVKNLMILGMPKWKAHRNGNSQKGYWAVAGSGILTHTITNKRLAQAGYYSILNRYESLYLCD